MNNKGFTLVELLAVIVLLLAISVLAVTNVTASLKRTEEKEIESQTKIAINAAKIYFSLNKDISSVLVSKLISEGYIKNEDKIGELKDNYYIKLCGNEYKYSDSPSC